jgi:hypothetical protein
MKIRTTKIDWDTDNEDIDEEQIAELPQTVELEVEDEEEIADALSDEFGFCVFSFEYETI